MIAFEIHALETNLHTLRAVRDNIFALATKGREGDPDATTEFALRHAAEAVELGARELERIVKRNQLKKGG